MLLAATISPCALCQLNSRPPQLNFRPPLTSRPAGVTLIATVESLTVAATFITPAMPTMPGSDSRGLSQISITTSWTVPANFTTIRLVGYLADASQPEGAAGELGSNAATAAIRERAGGGAAFAGAAALKPRDVGLTLFAERAGETNQSATRTDTLNLEIFGGANSGLHPVPNAGTLSILVQAL